MWDMQMRIILKYNVLNKKSSNGANDSDNIVLQKKNFSLEALYLYYYLLTVQAFYCKLNFALKITRRVVRRFKMLKLNATLILFHFNFHLT